MLSAIKIYTGGCGNCCYHINHHNSHIGICGLISFLTSICSNSQRFCFARYSRSNHWNHIPIYTHAMFATAAASSLLLCWLSHQVDHISILMLNLFAALIKVSFLISTTLQSSSLILIIHSILSAATCSIL